MKQFEEIVQEERQLLAKEESLSDGVNHIQKVQENYSSHFHEAGRFLDNLRFDFHSNEQGSYFGSVMDEFSQKANQIRARLETDETELWTQKKKLQDELEEIAYEKRRIYEEEKNEH